MIWGKRPVDDTDPLLRSSRDNRLTIQQKRSVGMNFRRMRFLRQNPWKIAGVADRIRRAFKPVGRVFGRIGQAVRLIGRAMTWTGRVFARPSRS